MLHYNPTITGGTYMPDKTTKETQRAYFRGLVAAGGKYIDQNDLHSGLSYKLFDSRKRGRPDKRIGGMVQVYFEGHEFLYPVDSSRTRRRQQPR